jgi:hypothetical protein
VPSVATETVFTETPLMNTSTSVPGSPVPMIWGIDREVTPSVLEGPVSSPGARPRTCGGLGAVVSMSTTTG